MKSSSASSAETERLGAELARTLRPGDIVLVSGELGSGKTTFVRGACRALGVGGPVTSPTFTIGHLYDGDVEIAHLDLYRLDEIDPSILEDYVTLGADHVRRVAGGARERDPPGEAGARGRRQADNRDRMSAWPATVDEVLRGDQIIGFAYVTPAKGVVLQPLTNMGEPNEPVSSSVAMFRKLERIQQDPHVAIAYHTRKHGFSDRPEYVLVHGRGSLTPVEDRGWVDRHRENGSASRARSRATGCRVDAAGVPLAGRDRGRHRPRGGLAAICPATGEPAVHGAPLRPTPPAQKPTRQGNRAEDQARARGTKGQGLPHVLLGWVGADGFPMVVPVDVHGADDRGLLLQAPDGLMPEGGRRAGLLAHDFARYATRQNLAKHTGWLEPTGDGEAVYAPHTQAGYRMPSRRWSSASLPGWSRNGARGRPGAQASSRDDPRLRHLDRGLERRRAARGRRAGREHARRRRGSPSGPRTPTELLPAIDEVMERAGVGFADLDAIAVGLGPGTFTGLRIGVATARALAKANDLPLRGVSSLAALAAGIAGGLRLPLIDAKRGEVYAALFEGDAAALAAGRARHRGAARAAARSGCDPAGGR